MSKMYENEKEGGGGKRARKRTLIFFPLQVMQPVLLRVYFGRFR